MYHEVQSQVKPGRVPLNEKGGFPSGLARKSLLPLLLRAIQALTEVCAMGPFETPLAGGFSAV